MSACSQNNGTRKPPNHSGLGQGYEFENNGKDSAEIKMKRVFEKDTSLKIVCISNRAGLSNAFVSNMNYLNRKGSAPASPLNRPKYNYESLRNSKRTNNKNGRSILLA